MDECLTGECGPAYGCARQRPARAFSRWCHIDAASTYCGCTAVREVSRLTVLAGVGAQTHSDDLPLEALVARSECQFRSHPSRRGCGGPLAATLLARHSG